MTLRATSSFCALLFALLGASCSAPSPEPEPPKQCFYQETQGVMCAALARVALRSATGTESVLTATKCDARIHAPQMAFVTWTDPERGLTYDGIAEFETRAGYYVPVRVRPNIVTYPCEDENCTRTSELSGGSLTLPWVPMCGKPPSTTQVTLTLPSPEHPDCDPRLEEWPMPYAAACWGVQPEPAYALFWHSAFNEKHKLYLTSDRATVYPFRRRARPLEAATAVELRKRLDTEFWTLPALQGHCGRDGWVYQIFGRREGKWRIVARGCRDIAGTLELFPQVNERSRSRQAPAKAEASAESASNLEPWREPCPLGPATPTDGSPSLIVDDLSSLYERCVADYLDVFGKSDEPIVAIRPRLQRQAICAALGSEGYSVFERAQSEAHFRIKGPEDCGAEKQELRMGRIIWEFSRLPNGKYLATRTARSGSPLGLMYQGHSIRTTLDGPLVITTATSQGWHCPLDPNDPCELYQADETSPGEVRCTEQKNTACVQAGVTSTVYVADSRSGAQAEFGDFHRRPEPSVKIGESEIQVTAGECQQTAKLPLSKVEQAR